MAKHPKNAPIPGDYTDRNDRRSKDVKRTTVTPEVPPAKSDDFREGQRDPLADARIIQVEVQRAADLHAQTIASHNQRLNDLIPHIEKLRDETKSHANVFGWQLTFGLFLGLLIGLLTLFTLLYNSIAPIIKSTVANRVRDEVETVEWEPLVNAAARIQVEKKITADVLADAVGDERIAKAAEAVLNSEAFNARMLEKVNSAAVTGADEAVKKFVEGNDYFRQAIDKQMEVHRQAIQKAMEVAIPVAADNRSQLQEQLLTTILNYQELRQETTVVSVHPFNDPLRLRANIWSRTGQKNKAELFWLQISIHGLDATTKERREAVEKYLGQELPASVDVARSRSNGKSGQYVAGIYWESEAGRFPTFRDCAANAAEALATLYEECFGKIDGPVEWRVTSGN